MFDWFVLLTPLLLLPVFLLFAFVGCRYILGIEEGVPRPPAPPPPTAVTFSYPAGLYLNEDQSPGAFPLLRRIAWRFEAIDLEYEGGGAISPNFDQEWHRRTTPLDLNPGQGEPLILAGEEIEFANIGEPISGTLRCTFRHNVDSNPIEIMPPLDKQVGDVDFWEWGFDINLTPF